VRQYSWAFGQPAWGWRWLADVDGNVLAVAAPAGTGAATGGPVAAGPDAPGAAAGGTIGEGFSQTNVQEQGVDEADLVETDGEFIYTLRPEAAVTTPPPGSGASMPIATPFHTELVIADAVPAGAMTVASRTSVDGTAVGMFLVGNRLAVVSQSYPFVIYAGGVTGAPIRFVGGAADSAIIDPGSPVVKVTVFDVTNRASPAVVEETTFEGSYDGSRAVGDRVYLIVHNDTWAPAPEMLDAGDADGGKVYESEASYRERLEATPLADLLPNVTAKAAGGESTRTMVSTPDVYVKDADAPVVGQNMATVAVLNVADDAAGALGTTTVAGWAGTVYASPAALYLASPFWDGDPSLPPARRAGTNLFKFDLKPDSVPLSATGEVGGSVLNQFSMSENGSDFRIATTTDPTFEVTDPDAPPVVTGPSNGVYVLRQTGEDLRVVGSVTKLAVGERIQSVRFVGDTGYVVTFRRVDPLFAIDLRDGTQPKVAGELKIPGFSSYLHPVGDGLLVGLGRDADEAGRTRGLQLSLFDVSHPSKPLRLDAEGLGAGSGYEWSEAETNHLAFSFFPESGIVAIPVLSSAPIVFADGSTAADGSTSSPHTLQVFRVSRDKGIEPLGQVVAAGFVQRSLRIGAVLYAIGNDEIRAADLASPGTLLGKLSLVSPDEPKPIATVPG
jgi:hypothetical protein